MATLTNRMTFLLESPSRGNSGLVRKDLKYGDFDISASVISMENKETRSPKVTISTSQM